MKRVFLLLATSTCLNAVVFETYDGGGSNPSLVNGDFEQDFFLGSDNYYRLPGWDFHYEWGVNYDVYNDRREDGFALAGWVWKRPSYDGSRALLVEHFNGGWFEEDRTWSVGVSQKVSMKAGDSVSGMALYGSGDWNPTGVACVEFYLSDVLVETPWFHTGPTEFGSEQWEEWRFTASEDGDYTIRLATLVTGSVWPGVTALHDNILMQSRSVPDTASTLLLLGMVLPALGLFRRNT